jgi:hypothetical protein
MVNDGIQSNHAATIRLSEPRLTARGEIQPSRISLSDAEDMTADGAAKLADALRDASERARRVDEVAIPHLAAFRDALRAEEVV